MLVLNEMVLVLVLEHARGETGRFFSSNEHGDDYDYEHEHEHEHGHEHEGGGELLAHFLTRIVVLNGRSRESRDRFFSTGTERRKI